MSADLTVALIVIAAGAALIGYGKYAQRKATATKDPWTMWILTYAMSVVIGGLIVISGLIVTTIIFVYGRV